MNPGKLAALALFGVSAVALAVGSLGAVQFRHASAKGPLLYAPSGLAVDEQGRLFVGVAGGHIYGYDPDGTLAAAWSLPAEGGQLRLAAESDGALRIASRDHSEVHRFTRDGRPLGTERDPEAFAKLGSQNDQRVATPGGLVFELDGNAIWQVKPGPARALVAEPRWPLRVFAGRPIGLVLLLLLGGVGPLVALLVYRSAR